MSILRTSCVFFICVFFFTISDAQYTRVDTIRVKANGNWLKMPWAGGHNYVQLSDIDMNFDGIKDLFVFDRTGHKVSTYINKGTPNTVDYVDSSSKYATKFPHLEDWVLLVDYNCDGKEDIFTYAITVGGIKVWRNTSSAGNLQFTPQTPYIKSKYYPSNPPSNLYVTRVDIPTIDDIDGDGDLDVLTFDGSSVSVEYHINQSQELSYNCDSLIFTLDPNGCWGDFQEDFSSCGINLGSCRVMNPDSMPGANQQKDNLHTGSCSLCLDMDADGDKEIIIGDISCCNMTMLTNGGSPSAASMIAKDTAFPSTDIPVNLNLFPCGYFLDVDNDNKRDLIVAPNAPNASVNNESIWYYKNIGADNAPVFSRVKKNLLQDEMIDVGEGANPVFFDFDNDGLTDLLISNYTMLTDTCHAPPYNNTYNVSAYKNIGTAVDPKFELITTNYANIDGQYLSATSLHLPGKHLTFGDLDGDGDQDMMIGDYNGFIHYFENTAGATSPGNFVLTTQKYTDDTGSPIDVGNYATPQLIDADRDGDLDLIIGEQTGSSNFYGNLNFYENIGTVNTPTFTLASNTFGGVHVVPGCCSGYSVPFMYDSAGSYRLIVGSEASRNYPATGWIWYYNNIDGNLGGNFTLVDSMYQNIWEGQRMTVNGKDINADGGMDLVIGNNAGGVALYMGDSNVVSLSELISSSSFDFTIFPNPSPGYSTINIAHFSANQKYNLFIYNSIGELIYSQPITHAQSKIDKSFSCGVYFYEIQSQNFYKTKKLVVLK